MPFGPQEDTLVILTPNSEHPTWFQQKNPPNSPLSSSQTWDPKDSGTGRRD